MCSRVVGAFIIPPARNEGPENRKTISISLFLKFELIVHCEDVEYLMFNILNV